MNIKKLSYHYFLKLILLVFFPSLVLATNDSIFKAEVLDVLSEKEIISSNSNSPTFLQEVRLRLLDSGADEEVITIENDFIRLKVNDVVFIEKINNGVGGVDSFIIKERDRTSVLFYFLAIFILSILFFGGMQGARSIFSLLVSFLSIFYLLIPAIMSGYSPVITSSLIATGILFVAIFFTHGFNRESTAAFLGTVISVFLAGFLSYVGVDLASFTGIGTEETFMLSLHGNIPLDFAGLLIAGIIIGALGVLDDVAVTQAVVVREMYSLKKDLKRGEVFRRSLAVGREHVGAMVNTLALAYTGAALPLILIFFESNYPVSMILSTEVVSVEIMRTIVGSIGLIFAVPLTTFFATYIFKNNQNN